MKNQKAITKAIGIKKAIAAAAKMATAANVSFIVSSGFGADFVVGVLFNVYV